MKTPTLSFAASTKTLWIGMGKEPSADINVAKVSGACDTLTVTYSSSDPSKLTVDENTGALTPVDAGNSGSSDVTITATSAATSKYRAASAPYTATVKQLKDVEGNAYPVVKIGSLYWMASNLKTTKYSDGSSINNIDGTSFDAWGTDSYGLIEGVYDWYRHDATNKDQYGALYSGSAVLNGKNLCPTGWRVSTNADWIALANAIGSTDTGAKLAGNARLWDAGTLKQSGNFASSGFGAVPAGYRSSDGGYFSLGSAANFWTSTQVNAIFSFRYIQHDNTSLSSDSVTRTQGYSVRCVK